MSAFSDAHGHTTAVDFTVSNHAPLWEAFGAIVDKAITDKARNAEREAERVQTGHTPDSIEAAAAEYRRMVAGLSRSTYGDLRGIDLDRVDWFSLIRDEVIEREAFARNFPPCPECGEGIPSGERATFKRSHHAVTCSQFVAVGK